MRCRVIFGHQRSKPRALLQPTIVSGEQQAHSWGQLFLWCWWPGTSIYSQVLMFCGDLKLLFKSQSILERTAETSQMALLHSNKSSCSWGCININTSGETSVSHRNSEIHCGCFIEQRPGGEGAFKTYVRYVSRVVANNGKVL